MSPEQARAIYPKAKVAAATASPQWGLMLDSATKCQQIGVVDLDTGAFTAIATLEKSCPFDDEDLLRNARDYIESAVIIAELSFDVIRGLKEELGKLQQQLARRQARSSQAQRCAMLCDRNDFRRFLMERTNLHDASDRERVINHVRFVLNISSRAELDTDEAAAARWKNLVGDFEAWKKSR